MRSRACCSPAGMAEAEPADQAELLKFQRSAQFGIKRFKSGKSAVQNPPVLVEGDAHVSDVQRIRAGTGKGNGQRERREVAVHRKQRLKLQLS